MNSSKKLSDQQVKNVFEMLGLESRLRSNDLSTLTNYGVVRKEIVFTRLSESSVPPPTGRIADANLEGTSK